MDNSQNNNDQQTGGLTGQQIKQDDSNQPIQAPVSPKLKEQLSSASVDQKVEEVAKLMQMGESNKIAKEEGDEYWENYSREIELEKEVLEMGGVEKVDHGDVPVPPQIAKEMGIQPVPSAQTPISQTQYFTVSGVSLTDDQIAQGLQKPTSSGFRWLSEWFIYQLLKAHFLVKKVKGKIVRSKTS